MNNIPNEFKKIKSFNYCYRRIGQSLVKKFLEYGAIVLEQEQIQQS